MLLKTKKNITVALAMSGGVDSSVSALLLKKRGFSVIGISMHLIPAGDSYCSGEKSCCSVEDLLDAKKIAVKLGIPHFSINLKDEFRSLVINPFIEEYISGKTPNPCIRCNNYLKFGILLKRAEELGADMMATGHYARVSRDTNGRCYLLKSRDLSKDQSYVLYNLDQERLKKIIFPVGNLSKESVRGIARDSGFNEISLKKDSMDICFVPGGDYSLFIGKAVPEKIRLKKGAIKNSMGETIGEHAGIQNYTVGQRKGLGISSKTPLYVTGISPEKNEIFVGPAENCYNYEMKIGDFNFITPCLSEKIGSMDLTVKIRYSSSAHPCRVSFSGTDKSSVKVLFKYPVKFIAPGQSAVLYSGQKVIGGGIIG